MKEVEIYTDGACSGNPGPGGWGAVLLYQGRRKELSGAEKETTNQRMELRRRSRLVPPEISLSGKTILGQCLPGECL